MERFEFVTSEYFDEMVEELGVNGISDLDITEELNRQNVAQDIAHESRIEAWDILENGNLEVYLEIL